MKVSNIEEYVGADGPCWTVSFEEKKLTLTEKERPSYSIGDELPFDLEVVKPEKGKWYYIRKGDKSEKKPFSGKSQRSYGKSPEELELSAKSYALSYAKDLAVGGKIALAEVLVVADDFHAWLKEGVRQPPQASNPLVEAAKEMGAVEKFAHKGEFLTRASKEHGLSKSQVEKIVGPTDDLTDLEGAWVFLVNSIKKE